MIIYKFMPTLPQKEIAHFKKIGIKDTAVLAKIIEIEGQWCRQSPIVDPLSIRHLI
ncbi:hypothetical protein [Cyclobacterium sp.]|uniref:hypothetical protein n=1 Tax=Cyclobacterium sp. TaxID=1966343 RepID=UPI0025BA1515|nr:hypothetical protein [Cyclobacterium sp.]